MAAHRYWSDWQIEYLKANYGKLTSKQIGIDIGKSTTSVRNYAMNHGIKHPSKFKDDEIEYIRNNVGRLSYKQIAKKLQRNEASVRCSAYYHGCPRYLDEERLKLIEVSRLTGLHYLTISRTWGNHGLKMRKVGGNVMIKISDLLKFMQEHPERWDATKCEAWYFDRYDWFNEKRKADRQKMINKRWGTIT